MRVVSSIAVAALAIVVAAIGTTSTAADQKRIALLIGNKDYKPGVGALVNPLNDVRLVSQGLSKVGFEVMRPVQNANRRAILNAVHEFADKLKAAGTDAVGFLYSSGHGLASDGENYLVPIDLDDPSTVKLRVDGVRQSEVLTILRTEAPNAAHYLVLDACRNTLQGARGGKGFVPVGEQAGVLVAYSTAAGKTASDVGQGSGPYAAALAAELVKPGQDDFNMFHQVRLAVVEKTRGDQVPWTEDGIQRRERVKFGGEATPAPQIPAHNNQEVAALKDQLARMERELKRQQDSGAASAREMAALKEAQVKKEAELKRKEEDQWDPLESTCRHASLSIL